MLKIGGEWKPYEHVPYYHKIFDKCGLNVYNIKDSSEISKIPTLDKAEIIANLMNCKQMILTISIRQQREEVQERL